MKKLTIFALALVCLLGVFCMVSFADEDVNAPYYDKVYTAQDGTPLALYDKEEVEGVTTYYPLVWFAFDTTNDEGETVTTYVKVRYDDANPYTREYSQGRFNAVSYSYTYTDGAEEEQTVELNNSNVVLLNLRDAYVLNGTSRTNVRNFESNGNDKGFTRMEAIYFPITIGSISNRSSGWAKIKVVDIPENITGTCSINKALFNANKSIEEIYLPSKISFGGDNSHFQNCSNLKKVTFGPSFNGAIPNYLFQNCTSLVEFNQNGAVFTTVGSQSFENCSNANLAMTLDLSSATSIGQYAFKGCKNVTLVNGDLSEVKSVGRSAFEGCTWLGEVDLSALKTIDSYSFKNCTNFSVKNGNLPMLESVGQQAFESCTSLSYIKTGANLASVGIQAFLKCTGLLAIDMSDCTNTNVTFGWGAFYDCSNLYAVQLPAKTTTMASRMFRGCGNLRALYLPDVLTTLDGNNSDHGPFAYCYELYFVNEEMDIDDYFVDGEFSSAYYLANLPEKPQVYYFPKTLTTIHSSTQVFRHCTGLNDVLVFDENLTKIETGSLFLYAGNNSEKKVVFLGDIEVFNTGDNRKNVSFYFVNPADTDFASIGITSGSTTNNNNAYIYFCANGDCYDYKGTSDGRATQAKLETSPIGHLYVIDKEATCTEEGGKGYSCFCGEKNPGVTPIPALGHTKGDFIELKYDNGFLKVGYYYYKCTACDVERYTYTDKAEYQAPAIFVNNGYAYSGTAFLQGFAVNLEALGAYEATGKTVQYGLAVASVAKLGATNTLFDGTTLKAGAFSVSFDDKKQYSIFEMQVTGLVDDYKDAELFVCAYVIDGDTVTYISNGANTTTVEAVTYNQVVANAAQDQTTDIIVKKEENV